MDEQWARMPFRERKDVGLVNSMGPPDGGNSCHS
jgi:hypothetical protein